MNIQATIQTLTVMKDLAEHYRKKNIGETITYSVQIERKCLVDEINALNAAIKVLEKIYSEEYEEEKNNM